MNATINLEKHFPVLLKELVSIISPLYGGTFIDCTFGQGGYSNKILENKNNKVIAIDRDKDSCLYAKYIERKYNKRFHLRGIINTFLFINIIIIPVGFINYMLDANYMFICQPPNVQSSFIIGDWPYYLFYLEGIYLIYIFVLYLPFWIIEKIQTR